MLSGPNITMRQTTFTTNYDDIVTFGHVLATVVFAGDDEPIKKLLAYFEKPWKWESEYYEWRRVGGTLDETCLDAFHDWYNGNEK